MDYIVNHASFATTPDMSVFGVGFRFRRSFAGQVRDRLKPLSSLRQEGRKAITFKIMPVRSVTLENNLMNMPK